MVCPNIEFNCLTYGLRGIRHSKVTSPLEFFILYIVKNDLSHIYELKIVYKLLKSFILLSYGFKHRRT